MKRTCLLLLGLMSSVAFAHRDCPSGLHHSQTFFEQLNHPSEALLSARPRANSTYLNALKLLRRDSDRNFLIYLSQKYGLPHRLQINTSVIDRGSFMWTPMGEESEQAIRQHLSETGERPPPPTEVLVQGKMYVFKTQPGFSIRDDQSGKILLDWPTFNYVRENPHVQRDVFSRADRDLMQSLQIKDPERAFAALKAYITLNFSADDERPEIEAEFQARLKFMNWLNTQITALQNP